MNTSRTQRLEKPVSSDVEQIVKDHPGNTKIAQIKTRGVESRVTPSPGLLLACYIYIVSIYAMRYTWTDEKYRDNLRRHHIAFEDAIRIFEGPTVKGSMIVSTMVKSACMPLGW